MQGRATVLELLFPKGNWIFPKFFRFIRSSAQVKVLSHGQQPQDLPAGGISLSKATGVK